MFKKLFLIFLLIICSADLFAANDLISLFPIQNYDQSISRWLLRSPSENNQPLINASIQAKHQQIFYDHYFGTSSPWDPQHVKKLITQQKPDDINTLEHVMVAEFDNAKKTNNEVNHGMNFRPHNAMWLQSIVENINFSQLEQISYQANNRAISVKNIAARLLPTIDPAFFNHLIAGQGYPFDNLQESAIWAGTPLYIIATSKDQAWYLVLTPDFIGWVQAEGVARVDDLFVTTWRQQASQILLALTQNNLSILYNQQYLFTGHVGAIFPGEVNGTNYDLYVPVKNANQLASIVKIAINKEQAAKMPLPLTRINLALVLKTMIGRPYGWGGLNFYNDCSAETKSIFTPFGIYLPRHSAQQINAGKMLDFTKLSPEQRLASLKKEGKPLITLIYIGGHVILYIGDFDNEDHTMSFAMTYQNMWGLKPPENNRRAVIGQAVLFPLLLNFKEDNELKSQAATSFFQIALLDQIPDNSNGLFVDIDTVPLRELMFPGITELVQKRY